MTGVDAGIGMEMTDEQLLDDIANTLEKWATQSQSGGWSTHQVEPQRKLADHIYAHLYRKKKRRLADDSKRW